MLTLSVSFPPQKEISTVPLPPGASVFSPPKCLAGRSFLRPFCRSGPGPSSSSCTSREVLHFPFFAVPLFFGFLYLLHCRAGPCPPPVEMQLFCLEREIHFPFFFLPLKRRPFFFHLPHGNNWSLPACPSSPHASSDPFSLFTRVVFPTYHLRGFANPFSPVLIDSPCLGCGFCPLPQDFSTSAAGFPRPFFPCTLSGSYFVHVALSTMNPPPLPCGLPRPVDILIFTLSFSATSCRHKKPLLYLPPRIFSIFFTKAPRVPSFSALPLWSGSHLIPLRKMLSPPFTLSVRHGIFAQPPVFPCCSLFSSCLASHSQNAYLNPPLFLYA